MAKSATKPKGNAGRKRKHPEGSLEFRFHLAPDEIAALEAYRAAQEFPPDMERMFSRLVRRFLIEAGYLKEAK